MSEGPEPDAIGDALVAIWERNRERILGRVAVVLEALEDGAAGRATDAAAAAREAHALAGALGMYGRPGSQLFAEVEQVLEGDWLGAVEYLSALAQQVRGLRPEL